MMLLVCWGCDSWRLNAWHILQRGKHCCKHCFAKVIYCNIALTFILICRVNLGNMVRAEVFWLPSFECYKDLNSFLFSSVYFAPQLRAAIFMRACTVPLFAHQQNNKTWDHICLMVSIFMHATLGQLCLCSFFLNSNFLEVGAFNRAVRWNEMDFFMPLCCIVQHVHCEHQPAISRCHYG